jgi:hypothetical protein
MEWYGFFIVVGIFLVYAMNIFYLKYKNISMDINELAIYIYCGAFFGGKLTYILCDHQNFLDFDFSLNILCGGFSLLGASFFALISLLYYVKKNNISFSLSSFLPISLLFLHCFGRVGCFFAHCCGGSFYTVNLYFISIGFYFITASLGLCLYFLDYLVSFSNGLYYYIFIIFLERFLFDIYRYDAIIVNNFFTKYQMYSLYYLIMSFLLIYLVLKRSSDIRKL